jgi:hypothetical protein
MSTGGEPIDVRAEIEGARAQSRRVRRRRRVRAAIAAIVGVALLVVAALFLTDTVRIGGGTRPALADRAAPTTAATTPVGVERVSCRAPLSFEDPLRVWIGGDSLAGSLGPSLGELAADTGVGAPTFDSRVSSGLASPEFFDWPEYATGEMARLNPEATVFIIGTNDFNIPRTQPVDATGEPAWKASYALLVEEMLDVLDGDGDQRPVYWVGAPPMLDRRKDAGVREINAVARSVVARHSGATYVDAYSLFAGPDGKFAATLPGADGKSVRVRTSDGVHFTPAGGDLLAEAVFEHLDTRCRLTEQAVDGRRQPVVQTKGSGQLPGTHRQTTTPSTPAPTAAPPTAATSPPTTTASTPPAATLALPPKSP